MITVRKAQVKDINLILSFEKKLYDSAVSIMENNYPEHMIDIILIADYNEILFNFIKRMIYSKNGAIFISEINNKPVGHMIISIMKSHPIFKMKYYGRINTIYVDKEFRGLGVSSRLKDEAFKWFKNKKINRVSLNVFPDNKPAIKAYQRWGLTLSLLEMRMTI
jgi:ribosomal protein S18 acetylase RimI-like enzyme